LPISKDRREAALMEIVVVSDTHMPKRTKKLPRQLVKDLEKADLIIHAEHVFYDSKK
jgi:predicted phosphodiesterase